MSGLYNYCSVFRKFSFSPAFLLLIVLYAFAGDLTFLPYIFLAVLIHECGHFAAISLWRLKIDKVCATIVGFAIETNAGLSSYVSEIIVFLSGPAASILAAVFSSLAALHGFYPDELYFFAGINVVFGLFNLLPAAKLDGGRAFCALLYFLFSPYAAYRASFIVHILTAVLVTFAGASVLYQTKYNLSLLLIGIWLLFTSRPD